MSEKYEKLTKSMRVLLNSFEELYGKKADSIYLTGEMQELLGDLLIESGIPILQGKDVGDKKQTFLGLEIKELKPESAKAMGPNHCIVSRDADIDKEQQEGLENQECLSIDLSPLKDGFDEQPQEEPEEAPVTDITVQEHQGKEGIVFTVKDKVVMVVSEEGLFYGGQVVKDAALAYRALMRVLDVMQGEEL